MRFHIHRWKNTDLLFEQRMLNECGEPITNGTMELYWDYKVKKCSCGKEKKVLINMYWGQQAYVCINRTVKILSLVNKISLI